jgi:hypothetical protein
VGRPVSLTGVLAQPLPAHRATRGIVAAKEATMRDAIRNLFLISMLGLSVTATATAAPASAASAPNADVRAELAQRREELIVALHSYWMHGDFPVNIYQPKMVNIFRDQRGRLCAVANLVHASGHDELVDAQVKADNYIRLADLGTSGALADWILSSGFTREELVDLQGAGYLPMQNNINVNVNNEQLQLALDKMYTQQAPIVAERATLRARLATAEQKLRADSEKSLDVATARLVAARAAAHEAARPAVHD